MADLYALEPDPDIPGLPGDPVVRETEEQLLDVLSADIYLHALNCVQQFGDFHIAIAPGRFQERLCQRLMTDPSVRQLPWQRTHLWAVTDAPDPIWGSTFTSIMDLLEEHSGIPDANLHSPDLERNDPADAYEQRLQAALAWREKGQDRLDLVVVGLDAKGRLAGMPSTHHQADRLYITPEDDRSVCMTARLLNATRLIALNAIGLDCRGPLANIAGNPAVPTPLGGTLRWYVDRAACPE